MQNAPLENLAVHTILCMEIFTLQRILFSVWRIWLCILFSECIDEEERTQRFLLCPLHLQETPGKQLGHGNNPERPFASLEVLGN